MEDAVKERMRKIAEREGATVLETTFSKRIEPWAPDKVRAVWDKIDRVGATHANIADDIKYRKALLQHEDILEFQRCHQKLFWTMTDRQLMTQPHYRSAIAAMLGVRDRVVAGELSEDAANAESSSAVLEALTASQTRAGTETDRVVDVTGTDRESENASP